MSKLMEALRQQPKTKVIMVMGVKAEVPRFTKKQKKKWYKDYEQADEQTQAEMFCGLFKRPGHDECLLTPEFVIDELPDEDAITLVKKAFEIDFEGILKN